MGYNLGFPNSSIPPNSYFKLFLLSLSLLPYILSFSYSLSLKIIPQDASSLRLLQSALHPWSQNKLYTRTFDISCLQSLTSPPSRKKSKFLNMDYKTLFDTGPCWSLQSHLQLSPHHLHPRLHSRVTVKRSSCNEPLPTPKFCLLISFSLCLFLVLFFISVSLVCPLSPSFCLFLSPSLSSVLLSFSGHPLSLLPPHTPWPLELWVLFVDHSTSIYSF